MATNPFRGIYLDNRFYNFVPGSYNRVFSLKNNADSTQNARNFSILGKDFATHSVTLVIENSNPYTVRDLSSGNELGTTIWAGLSRYNIFLSTVGALGTSMPLKLVTPDGTSYLVVPTGSIDIQFFRPDAMNDSGAEYRINLSFESVE